MDINELKQEIEQKTGIPANLLTKETESEIFDQARGLVEYWRGQQLRQPISTREQFKQWFELQNGEETPDRFETLNKTIDNMSSDAPGTCPAVRDGGEIDHSNMPDGRGTHEIFKEWFLKSDICL